MLPERRTGSMLGEQELAHFVFEQGGDDCALLLVSLDGRIATARGATTEVLGTPARELEARDFTSLFAGSEPSRAKLLEQVFEGGSVRRRCWCRRGPGSRFWAEMRAGPVRDADGAVIGAAVAIRNIEELKGANEPRRGRPRLDAAAPSAQPTDQTTILDSISNPLFTVDAKWRFTYMNARCAQMLRKPADQLAGTSLWEELPVSEGSSFYRELVRAANDRVPVQFEEYYPLLNSWFEVHAYPHPRGLLVYFWDITDRKLEVNRFKQQALHDPLTGVANMQLFYDRAVAATLRAVRNGRVLALLVVDIDNLSAINARYGHSTGDSLIQTMAARLATVVRRSDTIARVGGDEFAILTSDHKSADGPALLAEKLLEVASQPINLAGDVVTVTVSIGIALFPADATDTESLNKAAHTALNASLAQGGNRYCFSSPGTSRDVLRRRAVEAELRAGIGNDELELWYQPEQDLATGEITATEALVRWRRHGSSSSPSEFMPAIYAADVLIALDHWVLFEACAQRARWQQQHPALFPVTVNIAAATLAHGNLFGMVREALEAAKLEPRLLELEFSATALDLERSVVADALRDLNALGVQLSLDHGDQRGWTAIAALEQFPIQKLKVDAAHLNSIDPQARGATVRAAIALAHALRRQVVAARTEHAAQLTVIRGFGCQAAQGTLIAPPAKGNGHVATGRTLLDLE